MTLIQRTANLIEDPRSIALMMVVLFSLGLWVMLWMTMDRSLPRPLMELVQSTS